MISRCVKKCNCIVLYMFSYLTVLWLVTIRNRKKREFMCGWMDGWMDE